MKARLCYLDITVRRRWSWALGRSWEASFRVPLGGQIATVTVVSHLGAGQATERAVLAMDALNRFAEQ